MKMVESHNAAMIYIKITSGTLRIDNPRTFDFKNK